MILGSMFPVVIGLLGQHEVIVSGGYRLAVLPGASASSHVLALSEVSRDRLRLSSIAIAGGSVDWTIHVDGSRARDSGAVCSIDDIDGDGAADWALVYREDVAPGRSGPGVLIVGSGREGKVLRTARFAEASDEMSICHVGVEAQQSRVVIGLPSSAGGSVNWFRVDELVLESKHTAPDGSVGFGWYVGARGEKKGVLEVSAPYAADDPSLWLLTSGKSVPQRACASTRTANSNRLLYGSWVAHANDTGDSGPSAMAIGLSGLNTVQSGSVLYGHADAWSEARRIRGPKQPFGSCFGYVVGFTDDVDGDKLSDLLVTDPQFHLESEDSPLRGKDLPDGPAGACYLVLTKDLMATPSVLCHGRGGFSQLGTAMVVIEDLDKDGCQEVALLAPGTLNEQDAYVSIWSPKARVELQNIRLRAEKAK